MIPIENKMEDCCVEIAFVDVAMVVVMLSIQLPTCITQHFSSEKKVGKGSERVFSLFLIKIHI